ncbi:hypothetical protein PSTT_04479, partial [Puccinia striiformis]
MATMAHEPLEDEQDALRETFSEELIRHWMNERLAPEVLAHQEDLMERACQEFNNRYSIHALLLILRESISSDHFRFMLIETEIEHARYICKAYARCRMYKVKEQTLVHNLLYDSVLDQLPIKYRKLDEDHMIIRPNLDQGVFIIVRSSCGPAFYHRVGTWFNSATHHHVIFSLLQYYSTEPLMLEKGSKHFICYRSIKPFLNLDM